MSIAGIQDGIEKVKETSEIHQAIIDEFLDEKKHLGLIHFGSTSKEGTVHSSSDVDIAIFPKRSKKFRHIIEQKNGIEFDVFEMPIDFAFYLLRTREPLWIHGFATGKIIHGLDNLKVLQSTAIDILHTKPSKITAAAHQKIAFELTHCQLKFLQYSDCDTFSSLYYSEFIKSVVNALIAFNSFHKGRLLIAGKRERLQILTSEFGKTSDKLKALIKEKDSNNRITLCKAMMDELDSKYNLSINYPVIVQPYTDVTKSLKLMK